ncbi:MAG: 2-(1,2-epoxy,2-dihydrophenyl)acetyl-CoA isomerase [Thermoplasmata archaeon]|jgi:2-(1,2-epoxy-1,2-dihydrophenyl)acetyl-CoA isomerase|nr:2-(1,2-epoxy,2-dihydrophenyl)acetyl-CoA isomerase [Thermoplasmata archaeon]
MSVLLARRDAGVLHLTLNRPDKRNALNPELIAALREQLALAAKDADVRAVLLTGAGPVFCAGGDLDTMVSRRGDAFAAQKAQETMFGALVKDVLLLEKPVVALVNGDAHGAGLMLMLACDYAVAAPSARFAASFTRIGLVPDTGGSWLLPKTLGLRAARELALLPDPMDAKRAQEIGLVNAVAEDAAERAGAIARRWAEGPTIALGLTKKAIVLGTADNLEGALGREAALQGLAYATRDHAEGVDALKEKRAARYEGR